MRYVRCLATSQNDDKCVKVASSLPSIIVRTTVQTNFSGGGKPSLKTILKLDNQSFDEFSNNGKKSVFLTTDSQELEDTMGEYFKSVIQRNQVGTVIHTGNQQKTNQLGVARNNRDFLKTFSDWWLLRSSNYKITTDGSSFGESSSFPNYVVDSLLCRNDTEFTSSKNDDLTRSFVFRMNSCEKGCTNVFDYCKEQK